MRIALLTGVALLLVCLAPASTHAEWPPPWLKKSPDNPAYPRLMVEARELADSLNREDWIVVDARPRRIYRFQHIPGALNIDARALDGRSGDLPGASITAGVPEHGVVLCYSDQSDPAAAGELLWLFEATGRPDVRVLNGGLEAWTAGRHRVECTDPGRSLPMENSGSPLTRSGTNSIERAGPLPDTSRVIDYERLRASFGMPGITILDTRSDSLWKAGHIPHSLPFPITDAVDESGHIADGPTLRSLIAAIGPRPGDFVNLEDLFIVTTGPETKGLSAHPYLIARAAGIERVKGYPEGFDGWGRHRDAPVVTIVDAAQVRNRLEFRWAPGAKDRPSRNFILLDLRAEGDYARGHLPGAVYIAPEDFRDRFEALVREHWGNVDRRTIPVVFYCYGPGCIRSRNCSTWAARLGFQHLDWFRDGTLGWRQIGEELVH